MIPKIIHYIWLSGDKYPAKIQNCMDSWTKKLPDYEFKKWDLDQFDIKSSKWVEQAYHEKKYAFAADFLRLYALYHHGGIYLDSDVEVLRTFNGLLDLPYFFGKEDSDSEVEPAVIGAEKNCEWIKKCLDYYNNREFILPDGSYDIVQLPSIMTEILRKDYEIKEISSPMEFDYDNTSCVYRFPVSYFSPRKWDGWGEGIGQNTYTIHHFANSWISPLQRTKNKIRRVFNLNNDSWAMKFYRLVRRRKSSIV